MEYYQFLDVEPGLSYILKASSEEEAKTIYARNNLATQFVDFLGETSKERVKNIVSWSGEVKKNLLDKFIDTDDLIIANEYTAFIKKIKRDFNTKYFYYSLNVKGKEYFAIVSADSKEEADSIYIEGLGGLCKFNVFDVDLNGKEIPEKEAVIMINKEASGVYFDSDIEHLGSNCLEYLSGELVYPGA